LHVGIGGGRSMPLQGNKSSSPLASRGGHLRKKTEKKRLHRGVEAAGKGSL